MQPNRLLSRDVQRSWATPNFILAGTRTIGRVELATDSGLTVQDLEVELAEFKPHDKTRIIAIPWYANAFDGVTTATVDYGSKSPQLLVAWLLGTASQDDFGRVHNPGGGSCIITGNTDIYAATSFSPSFTAANLATCRAEFSDTSLVITVTSVNAGVPLAHVSYFAIGTFYDELDTWGTRKGYALG